MVCCYYFFCLEPCGVVGQAYETLDLVTPVRIRSGLFLGKLFIVVFVFCVFYG